MGKELREGLGPQNQWRRNTTAVVSRLDGGQGLVYIARGWWGGLEGEGAWDWGGQGYFGAGTPPWADRWMMAGGGNQRVGSLHWAGTGQRGAVTE